MNNLGQILRHLYPSANPLADFRVQDDGSGPYIAHWDEAKLGPRPTQEELDSVDVAKIEHNAGINRQISALEATVTPRRIREAVRGSGKAWLDALDDQINALRAQRQ